MARTSAHPFRAIRSAMVLALALVTSVGLITPAAASSGITIVRPGQSIQAAIDNAQRGDRILVAEGTYAEQLTLDKDGITLIGLGAVLIPPVAPVSNTCSGLAGSQTEAGICVTGKDVVLQEFVIEHRKFVSVGHRVQDVTVTGFQVRNFSGENVAVVGAAGTRVFGNRFADGPTYGFLTVGSVDTRVTANIVSSAPLLGFIGICMDDVSGVQVSRNHISGYNIALCVQTAGAQVRGNDVRGNCVGVFVDPGVDGAQVLGNRIGATNPLCRTQSAFGNFGIFIDGAVNTQVRRNHIEGQTNFGVSEVPSAGLVLVDEGDAIAAGNAIVGNIMRNNSIDLVVFATGAGNLVTQNKCDSSLPEGLCG